MARPVKVVISHIQRGTGTIVPFSRSHGLQLIRPPGSTDDEPVVYRIPVHEVHIETGGKYLAVRFGLVNHNQNPPPKTRVCDAGLALARVCKPAWIPNYSPHSFEGGARPGGWQLIPEKNFLIHEGADRTKNQLAGSLGCIEVLDGSGISSWQKSRVSAKPRAR